MSTIITRLSLPASGSEGLTTVSPPMFLPAGYVAMMRCRIPTIASGEVGFRVLDHGGPFAPDPIGDRKWFTTVAAASPETVEWEERRAFSGNPAMVNLEGYNTSAAIVIIELRLGMMPTDERALLIDVLQHLRAGLPKGEVVEAEKPEVEARATIRG